MNKFGAEGSKVVVSIVLQNPEKETLMKVLDLLETLDEKLDVFLSHKKLFDHPKKF